MDSSATALGYADYGIIACFFLVMLGIGAYFTGRIRNMDEYFAGGRAVPWWLSGISFYMTSFSAFAFVAYSAVAYQYGFVAMTYYWCSVPAIIVSAVFFAGRWRRAASTSPLEYIEKRYSVSMRQILVWLSIPMRIIDNGLKLFAIGKLVSVGLDFPMTEAIFWTASIMIAYTFMGGLWAVVVTDFVQFVIKGLVMIVLVPLALSRVGGVSGLIDSLPPAFLQPLAEEKYNLNFMIVWGLILLMNVSTSWALVQRYFSVSTTRDARKVGFMMAGLNVVTAPIMMLPALAAVVFLPGIQDPNSVYAVICKELLPVGMKGMMIAAMFSATMSSLSGEYNALASGLTNDVYKRMLVPQASDKNLVLVGRLSTLFVGLTCMGVAFIIAAQDKSDIFEKMVKVFSIFLPPVAIPMLLGLVTRHVSKTGGLAGLLMGIIAGLAAFFISYRPGYENWSNTTFLTPLTIAFSLFGVIAGTMLRPSTATEAERTRMFLEHINAPGETQDEVEAQIKKTGAFSPFKIMGVATAVLGAMVLTLVLILETIQTAYVTMIVGIAMMMIGLFFGWVGRRTTARDEAKIAADALSAQTSKAEE